MSRSSSGATGITPDAGSNGTRSTDGGTSWTDIPPVTDTTAFLISTTDLVRFNPADDFHGTPGNLSVRLVDDSNGAVTTGNTANVAGVNSGGTTPYSDAGNAVTLDFNGDQLIKVAVTEGALKAAAVNGGLIQADGGLVLTFDDMTKLISAQRHLRTVGDHLRLLRHHAHGGGDAVRLEARADDPDPGDPAVRALESQAIDGRRPSEHLGEPAQLILLHNPLGQLGAGHVDHADRRGRDLPGADERRRLDYGVRRVTADGSSEPVRSIYARVEDLADLSAPGNEALRAIAGLAITEIFDIAADAGEAGPAGSRPVV